MVMTTVRSEPMSQQYYPIILQIGARFIRAGFAGDAVPIVRRRTNVYDLQGAHITPLSNSHAYTEDHGELDELAVNEEFQFLWSYDLTGTDFDRLESVLERIMYDLYQTDLLVDSKKCKVLIIEPPFFPIPLKNIISKVLLFHIHAQSVRFFPEPVMSTISSGSHCALVIDIGWNQTTVTPVFDLRQLYRHSKTTLRGGWWLHQEVRRAMDKEDCLAGGFEFVERFIAEAMYIEVESERVGTDYDFEGSIVPSRLRSAPIENVFFPESDGLDDNARSISVLVDECLREMNIDLRGSLKDKVIITGGVSHIPGLKTRLLRDLGLKSGAEGIQSLGAWEGASLYCSTALMSPSSVDRKKWPELVRDRYLAGESSVVDWTDDLFGRNLY